jgi:hypothetical protein
MPFEPNQLSGHFPSPFNGNETKQAEQSNGVKLPLLLEIHEEKAPLFPLHADTLRPCIFRIGCLFCGDIVLLP